MIEAGEVGAVFKIVDDASPALRRIADEFKVINAEVNKTKEALSAFGSTRLTGVTARLAQISSEFAKLGENVERVSLKISGGFDSAGASAAEAITAATGKMTASFAKLDESIATSIASIGRLKAESATLGGGAGGYLPGGSGKPSIRHGSGGGSGGGGLHYRAHGAAVPGGHISGGGDGSTSALLGGFTLYEIVKGGFETQHWLAQMHAAGATDEQVKTAYDASVRQAGLNSNSTISGNLKSIIEAKKATGDWDEASRLMPAMSVANYALRSITADGLREHFSEDGQIQNFGRALDEMGVTQKGATVEDREANIKHYAANMIKTMIAQRGLVTGNSFFELTNNSGGAAMNWNEEFATVEGPIIGGMMKAGKLGNADYMALRSYQQGIIPSKSVAQMLDMDINGKKFSMLDKGDVYYDKKGWHLKPNNKFSEGSQSNIWTWSGNLLKDLEAKGVDTSNQDEMNKIVNSISPNKSTGLMLRNLLEPQARALIQKEIDARNLVPENAAGILQAQDPTLKIDALKNKLTDLFAVLGGPLTDTAMKSLTKLTSGLQSVSQLLANNPGAQDTASTVVAGAAIYGIGRGLWKFLGLGDLFGGGAAAAGGAAGGAAAPSLLGRIGSIFARGAGAMSLPGLINAATDDNRSDSAKANDAAITNWIKGHFGGGGSSPALWDLNQQYRRQADMHPIIHGERDMEGARAKALSNLPAPIVNLVNNVKVFIDGAAIAARIEASIVSKEIHSTGAPAFDTHAMHASNDFQMATV